MNENLIPNCFNCKEKSVCFKQLNDEESILVDKNKTQIRFRKGEIISKEGSFITHIMYIKSGFAKVYKETSPKQNLIFDIIPSGKLIGLNSLFNTDNIARFSVAALNEAVVCSIDRLTTESLIHKNSNFAATVIASLNHESQIIYDKMASLAQKQMHGKLADALLYLSEVIFKSNEFKLLLSRQELADFTGMSMMSVVRTLIELKKEKIIEDNKGIIKILDVKSLKQISQMG